MPVSGLIITTDRQRPQDGEQARRQLAADPAITLGPSRGHRQVVVVETDDPQQDKRTFDWINDLPGVVFVDVVFVDFHADPAADSPTPRQPAPPASHGHA